MDIVRGNVSSSSSSMLDNLSAAANQQSELGKRKHATRPLKTLENEQPIQTIQDTKKKERKLKKKKNKTHKTKRKAAIGEDVDQPAYDKPSLSQESPELDHAPAQSNHTNAGTTNSTQQQQHSVQPGSTGNIIPSRAPTRRNSSTPVPNSAQSSSSSCPTRHRLLPHKDGAALLVIDVQNDFIDGSLALRHCPAKHEAAEIVPVINSLRTLPFKKFVWSLDYHPKNHCSFVDNVHHHVHDESPVSPHNAKIGDVVLLKGQSKVEQKLWPAHCVEGTWGAELHKDLIVGKDDIFVRKGTHPNVDSYSAFFDNAKTSATELYQALQKDKIVDIFVCGLALDYCVGSTALHGAELGFRVWVITDASRGVSEKSIECMERRLKEAGVTLTDSSSVRKMFEAVAAGGTRTC